MEVLMPGSLLCVTLETWRGWCQAEWWALQGKHPKPNLFWRPLRTKPILLSSFSILHFFDLLITHVTFAGWHLQRCSREAMLPLSTSDTWATHQARQGNQQYLYSTGNNMWFNQDFLFVVISQEDRYTSGVATYNYDSFTSTSSWVSSIEVPKCLSNFVFCCMGKEVRCN